MCYGYIRLFLILLAHQDSSYLCAHAVLWSVMPLPPLSGTFPVVLESPTSMPPSQKPPLAAHVTVVTSALSEHQLRSLEPAFPTSLDAPQGQGWCLVHLGPQYSDRDQKTEGTQEILTVGSHTQRTAMTGGSALDLIFARVTSHSTCGGGYPYAHCTGEETDLVVEVGAQKRSEPRRLAIT